MGLLSLCLLSFGALCLAAVSYSVYLLSFHPYAKYPGPLLARLTPLHSLWHAHIGDLHLDVSYCHKVYGEHSSPQTDASWLLTFTRRCRTIRTKQTPDKSTRGSPSNLRSGKEFQEVERLCTASVFPSCVQYSQLY